MDLYGVELRALKRRVGRWERPIRTGVEGTDCLSGEPSFADPSTEKSMAPARNPAIDMEAGGYMRPAGESSAQIEMAAKPSAVDDGADEIVGSVAKLVDAGG